MRYILCLFIAFSFAFSAEAQTKSINSFYNKYRFKEDVYNMTLPGWLVRFGVGVSRSFVDEEPEVYAALGMAKKVRKLKLMVMENRNWVKGDDIKGLVNGVKKDGYEELIRIKDEDANINILIREKKDEIRNLLILVDEPDEFIMLSMKTRLTMDELNEFIQEISSNKKESAIKVSIN